MQIDELVRLHQPFGEFKPYCIYDAQLDTIRVIVEDCNYTEVMFGPHLSLDQRNHDLMGNKTHVGFNIEGAREFCTAYDVNFGFGMELIPLLERLTEVEAGSYTAIVDIAIPMVKEHNLRRVEFPY